MSSRLRFVPLVAAALIAILLSGCAIRWPSVPLGTSNPIILENQQPATDTWALNRDGYHVAGDEKQQIKGYADATSVNIGQAITFFTTVNPAQDYTLDVYRIGWYQGHGGRLMKHVGPLQGVKQPDCPQDALTGMVACNWRAGYTLQVPGNWTSGIYLVLLTNAQKYQNYIVFVVRDDARKAAILYQQPVLTYQAYNNYPHAGANGKSLYDFNSLGANTVAGSARAVKVSFDRPYGDNGAGQFLVWEAYFVRWMESKGYDVVYATDIDTHANGHNLSRYAAFLSVGHDEYWTRQMYDSVAKARDAGVSLGFFGANALTWQVRLEPSAAGVANRVVTCYRDAALDPNPGPETKTVTWRSAPLNRPEQSLIGIQYTSIVKDSSTVPYVVNNASHWVYAGTRVKDGDKLAAIVGYEADRFWPGVTLPPGTGYTLLSHSSYTDDNGRADNANSSIYRAPSGAWVFAAGTIAWSWGLGREGYADQRIQQMTTNILNAFIDGNHNSATYPGATGH